MTGILSSTAALYTGWGRGFTALLYKNKKEGQVEEEQQQKQGQEEEDHPSQQL